MKELLKYIKKYEELKYIKYSCKIEKSNSFKYIYSTIKNYMRYDDINKYYKCTDGGTYANKWTLLHKLVVNTKKYEELEEFIVLYLKTDKGQNELNTKNSYGYTPIMLACVNTKTRSTLNTVDILINAGANLNLKNINGYTALMLSTLYSNNYSSIETIKKLIKAGANLNLQNRYDATALIIAIRNIDTSSTFETVITLIEEGTDLDLKNIKEDLVSIKLNY